VTAVTVAVAADGTLAFFGFLGRGVTDSSESEVLETEDAEAADSGP